MADLARFKRYAGICALVLGAILAVVFLLPIALPFLIGYALARCVERPVTLLQQRTGLKRWLCSGLCMLLLFLLAGGGLFLLIRQLIREVSSFSEQLPELLSGLAAPAEQVQSWLTELASRAPDGFGIALQNWIDSLFDGSSGLPGRLTARLFSFAAKIVAALPDLFLFVLTLVLSSFMFSANLPATRAAIAKLIPQKWQRKAQQLLSQLRTALGGWLKAQAMLMGVTFLVVTAGLMVLQLGYPLLFGALIALIDALPLLGAGVILIPWSLLSFLRGANRCAIGLILVYGSAALIRSALEPKLIGKQIGLHPILTLAAMYAGYRLMGLAGLILFPIAAILLQQVLKLTLPHRSEGQGG